MGVLLMLGCCLGTYSTWAHTPRPRLVEGVIQSVDFTHQTLLLACQAERRPRKFRWHAGTQFFQGLAPATVSVLAEGVEVTVYYHTPFFGPPMISKVVRLDPPH